MSPLRRFICVTAAKNNLFGVSEKTLLKALALSLVIHLTVFGTWKWGKQHGWWRQNSLPAWMQLAQKKLLGQLAKKNSVNAPRAVPLLFVDVDPSLASAEPPKDAKYYSSDNSEAANPNPKINSDTPRIDGKQDKVLKTTDDSTSKAKPLQPSPPTPEKADTAEAKALPKESYTPGDLAIAKPRDTNQIQKGKAEKNPGDAEQAKPQDTRPRTIAEANARRGIRGEKMKHEGGVNKIAAATSLDAEHSIFGDYDRELIDAVQQRWDQLIEDKGGVNGIGEVILEFRLWFDGRITDMKISKSSVLEMQSWMCQGAILDPKFKPWSKEMRREVNGDFRTLTFTFYYTAR